MSPAAVSVQPLQGSSGGSKSGLVPKSRGRKPDMRLWASGLRSQAAQTFLAEGVCSYLKRAIKTKSACFSAVLLKNMRFFEQ